MFRTRKIVKGAFAVLLCGIMAGCAGLTSAAGPETATPRVLAATTQKAALPTQTPATVILSTDTPGPENAAPTDPPAPEDTATADPPAASPAPLATPTRLPEKQHDARLEGFATTCKQPNDYYTLLSPDGNWAAVSCGYSSETSDQYLEVTHKDGRQYILKLKDYTAYEYIKKGKPSNAGIFPVFWAPGGKYLFFRSAIEWNGAEPCGYHYGGGDALFRIDVTDGFLSTILPPSAGGYYLFAFSPDGVYLAQNTLHSSIMLSVRSGEENSFYLGTRRVGELTWAPDSLKMAFSTCLLETPDKIARSSIQIYYPDRKEWKTILEVKNTQLFIASASGENPLKIYYYDSQTSEIRFQYFDWDTERFFEPTPTPAP